MFNKELAIKLDAFVKDKFPMIYEFEFEGYVFLRGGTLRSIIMGIPVKDLDFVILSQGKCQIIEFIRKFKLKYIKNAGGSYKIIYNNFAIDICTVNDLMDTAIYDIDFIFYDLKTRYFLSFGGIKAIGDKTITEIRTYGIPLYGNLTRINKLVNFVSFVSGSKKISVKENKIFFYFRFYKKIFKERINNIINGNFKRCFQFLTGYNNLNKLIILFKFIIEFISITIPLLVSMIIINIILKQYRNVILLIGVIIILKILSKCVSLIIYRWDLKLYNEMEFNICSDIAKALLCYQNNSNIFMDKIKNDHKVVSKMYSNIRDRFIWIICFGIMLLFVFFVNYIIGILTIAFTFLVYKYNRNKVRVNLYNNSINDSSNCMGTYGDMFYSDYNKQGNIYNVKPNNVKKHFLIIIFFIVLFMLLLLFKNNNIELYSLIFILVYIVKIFIYMSQFEKIEFEFLSFNRTCFRIFNLLYGTFYTKEVFGNYYSSSCNGNVEFDNVKFRYEYNSKYILNGCSFQTRVGEPVLLVCDNAIVRTTILNLIGRLYHVDDGKVKIDGIDLIEYSEDYIRDNIAIVSQSPYLFNMSIKDNLKLIGEDITDKKIKDVCKLVYMDKFIEKLPNKYDTLIGEYGVILNGNQKQKLCIARLLLHKTKIILFDNKIDSDIIKIKKKIKNRCTIIVVSDRVLFDDVFSQVLILNSGKIIDK